MSKRCSHRTLSRLPALILTIVVVASIAPPSHGQIDPAEVVDQIDEATLRHYLDDLLFTHDGDNRYITGPDHDPARDNIEATLRGFGLDPRLEPFRYSGDTYYNVVAIQEGLVTPDQQYIISGHFDSVGNPGADDDGTGCAAVMEIARVLTQYSFESTIIYIAFDAEEQGMIGSRAYVADHPDDDVRGMISLDMIGHGRGTGRADIYGHTESNPIKTALRDALATYNEGMAPRIFGELDRSDHAPFEWAGKEACLLIEAFGPDDNPCYHQACDSVDNEDYIHYDYLTQLTRGVTGYLVEHAGLLELPLEFHYPTGLPDLIDPRGGTVMRVEVSGSENAQPEPDTGVLHYFEDGEWLEAPMRQVEDHIYDAVFPAVPCTEDLSYYLSADTTDGDTINDPLIAPDRFYSATGMLGFADFFADDFETDQGWSVVNENLIDGEWERGVPFGSGDSAPDADFDGSGSCYVTGNRLFQDVDGGPTRLITPRLDLAGRLVTINFARYFRSGANDRLLVEVSNDDGESWTLVEENESDTSGWIESSFLPADFLELTANVRVRFSVADNPNNSFCEAGIDGILIVETLCGGGGCTRDPEWLCDGDVDGDGQVNPVDAGLVQAAFGSADESDLCQYDVDCDGQINPVDSGIVQSLFGTCEAPREACP